MESTLSRDELAFLMARAGLVLTPAQLDEVHAVAGYVEAMTARVWEGAAGAMPAQTFVPVEPERR